MQTKSRYGLRKKMLLSIIILSIFICTASSIAGYLHYKNTIEKLYNDNGYVIGYIILNQIDADKIAEYSQTWKSDGYHGYMRLYLDRAVESSKAKYIYIVVPEANGTMRYIYDSSGMNIGDYDPISKYVDDIMAIYNSGEENRTNRFVRKSPKYGYLTSSVIPIKTGDGETVALLFIDVAMEVIRSTLWSYILTSVVISFILMIIFCQICHYYMNRTLISPIRLIEKSLKHFADNNAEITDELNSIKTKDELQSLSESLYSMEESIVQYIDKITDITAEKERIGAELNVATQIQANMLPSIFPPFPDRSEFDIFASMNPAKEVGGDFYDFFMIDDSHVGIVMADVSGKGVPAALFMVISKTLIKNRAKIGDKSPAEVLQVVNNQLCENNKVEMFVTVWFGVLDIKTGIITAANAGHEFPTVKHNGKYELIKDKHGFVVAGMENIKYKDYEIKLEKGDSLFVYTDGVAEATNADNELFGTERMLDALNIEPESDCRTILSNVQAAVDDFVKDAPQFDDITMLCLQYYGSDTESETSADIKNIHNNEKQPPNTNLSETIDMQNTSLISEKTINVTASIENLSEVTAFIDEFLETNNCPIKYQTQLDIAVDEIFSNISLYAYDDTQGSVSINIRYCANPDRFELRFTDSGKEYNPLLKEDPDTTLSADEREIGGLGIFIVKKSMDDMYYEYNNNQNMLTIIKNV